ncbi:DUF2244 domain-containing protein [Kiloniella sp. b19]|uniref:DUF2244 domain-containing protein n=1 Tax=Kiloniella sp. GXU_MW_B19 TaxID=3141326 RepID=UPI0031E03737
MSQQGGDERTRQITSVPMVAQEPGFDLILTPHRSFSDPILNRVLLIVSAVALTGSVILFSLGAWPIVGFLGVDVLLLWWAFRASSRSALRQERLTLRDHQLLFSRRDHWGKTREWLFQPVWSRWEFSGQEEDSRLKLSMGGMTVSVGTFLSHQERKELYRTVSDALHHYR